MDSKQFKLNRTDCGIIELLQKDGRIPNTEIAKILGVSEATVRSRLNRLIENDIIQIVAVSNPLKLGFETVGVIRINVEKRKLRHVISELSKIKAIWFIVQTTGDSDIYTEFAVSSNEELSELIYGEIAGIDGVKQVETTLILNYIKRKYDWGTGKRFRRSAARKESSGAK